MSCPHARSHMSGIGDTGALVQEMSLQYRSQLRRPDKGSAIHILHSLTYKAGNSHIRINEVE